MEISIRRKCWTDVLFKEVYLIQKRIDENDKKNTPLGFGAWLYRLLFFDNRSRNKKSGARK